MTNLLAIETSSEIGSIAVLAGDRLTESAIATPREQTARILPLIDELLSVSGLELSDLDGIAFGRGPGSFTGVRVATAIAQGVGLATDTTLLPVSSLAATAQQAWRIDGVERSLIGVDARMGEVFWCEFELQDSLATAIGAERLSSPGAVVWTGSGGFACLGSAFARFPDELAGVTALADRIHPDTMPTAADLLPLALAELEAGRGVAAVEAAPVYLRGEGAWRAQR